MRWPCSPNPRVSISARIPAMVRCVRDGGGGSAPDSEDSQIGSGIDYCVDDCRNSQSHFRVGIWLVLCRCSHGDGAGCHLSLADTQAIPLVNPKVWGDGCRTNAQQIVGRTVGICEFMDMPKESVKGEEIMATATTARPPFPPFTRDSAMQKVRLAEDAWNTRDPAKVAPAYAIDSRWRNRSEFINRRNEIIAFLSRKWTKELDYRLIKELWTFTGNRIAVRFAYEWHDDSGHWYRSYGNENWEFNDDGLMAFRFASINDLPIKESERKYHWPLGRRPDDHPGLSDLGL